MSCFFEIRVGVSQNVEAVLQLFGGFWIWTDISFNTLAPHVFFRFGFYHRLANGWHANHDDRDDAFFFDSFVVVCGQLSDVLPSHSEESKARWFLKLLLRWLYHVHMFQVSWNYQRFAKIRHSIAIPCDRVLELLYSFSSTGTQVFTQNVQDSGIWRLREKNQSHPKKLQKSVFFFVNVVFYYSQNGS